MGWPALNVSAFLCASGDNAKYFAGGLAGSLSSAPKPAEQPAKNTTTKINRHVRQIIIANTFVQPSNPFAHILSLRVRPRRTGDDEAISSPYSIVIARSPPAAESNLIAL